MITSSWACQKIQKLSESSVTAPLVTKLCVINSTSCASSSVPTPSHHRRLLLLDKETPPLIYKYLNQFMSDYFHMSGQYQDQYHSDNKSADWCQDHPYDCLHPQCHVRIMVALVAARYHIIHLDCRLNIYFSIIWLLHLEVDYWNKHWSHSFEHYGWGQCLLILRSTSLILAEVQILIHSFLMTSFKSTQSWYWPRMSQVMVNETTGRYHLPLPICKIAFTSHM